MSTVHLTILYYSSTGTNYTMAQTAAAAASELGAEVRVVRVAELAPQEVIASNLAWKAHVEKATSVPIATLDDIGWADAVIISTPTRFGNVASQLKQFLDTTGSLWAQGKLTNKVVSAMTSASNLHGGQEATVLSLYTSMYHWGAIVVAPGYTDSSIAAAGGNPYGTSLTVDIDGKFDINGLEAVKHQARRVVTVAGALKKGFNV
ncbi:NAD(P)H:quinone oxidoreductase, type IV [Paenibacillus pectinilyticus]|uniref:NAD(P)H:quinone oxidoreductase, type IV n=1 Tax=Paenibacillus pectinilyticus TaxID=512399 RepID=A0A1C1A733_9BACL|nr:NAD(P)H:quinone oxidoreductase [Paenibacillus pectinilyticus]OCT16367.1 NAD(P)H:quinone oxidoreductase, type IV [Paenibacillus pectinilyticus]